MNQTLLLLLRGNAKASAAGLAALFGTLATAAATDGISVPELLAALAALFVAIEGVRRIPNTGPKANATEVPLVDELAAGVTDLIGGVE